eukprot:3270140-Amphidinium_carterae.1
MTTFKKSLLVSRDIYLHVTRGSHLATLMEDVKYQKDTIVDDDYIQHELEKRELSQKDADKIRAKELQRLLRDTSCSTESDIYEEKREPNTTTTRCQREQGEDVEPNEELPPLPKVPEDFKPFTEDEQDTINEYIDAFRYYSKVLQYTLTKATQQIRDHLQPQQLKRIRDLEKITCYLRSRRKSSTTTYSVKNTKKAEPSEFIKNFQTWREEI